MPTLFMVQLGGRPKGRLIEQHDMFFGIADDLVELIPAINEHWPEVKNKWHVDSYRAVTRVDGYRIDWVAQAESDGAHISPADDATDLKLFFINLGGYLPDDFEEYHHKLLIVAPTQAQAIKQAKQSDFYKKYSFKDKDTPFDAASHIDDKHQVDVDDIYNVSDLLTAGSLQITKDKADTASIVDKAYIGYLSIKNLRKLS